MTGAAVLVVLVVYAVSVYTARRLAARKNRLPGPWGLAALLAGPVVVLVLAVAPTRRTAT